MSSPRSLARTLFCIVLPLLQQVQAVAAPAVTIARRAIVIVPSIDSLAPVCPSQHRIHGCTVFAQERLAVQCAAEGSEWRINASASMDATLYLWDPRRLGHEAVHIQDLRGWLAEYVGSMNRIRFQSLQDCRAFADGKEAAFPSLVNALKLQSNEKRDRIAYAGAGPRSD